MNTATGPMSTALVATELLRPDLSMDSRQCRMRGPAWAAWFCESNVVASRAVASTSVPVRPRVRAICWARRRFSAPSSRSPARACIQPVSSCAKGRITLSGGRSDTVRAPSTAAARYPLAPRRANSAATPASRAELIGPGSSGSGMAASTSCAHRKASSMLPRWMCAQAAVSANGRRVAMTGSSRADSQPITRSFCPFCRASDAPAHTMSATRSRSCDSRA